MKTAHTPEGNTFIRKQVIQLFKGNLQLTPTCWLWTGYISSNGYGRVRFNKKKTSVHRLSFRAFIGEIPKELFVCHSCDVRNCIRSSHLFLGTNQENMEDAKEKGRLATKENGRWSCGR